MRPFIKSNFIFILLIVSFSFESNGQVDKHGLTDEQYEYYRYGYRNKNKYPELAIKVFDSLLQIRPDFCYGYYFSGLAYFDLKKFENASKYFKKMIECDPTKPPAYKFLSQMYIDREQYDSAENIILAWMKYEEFDRDAFSNEYYALGKITRTINEYHKSIEYLTKSILIIKKHNETGLDSKWSFHDTYYLRADSYLRIGELELALSDLKLHKSLQPEDRSALVLEGEILQEMERYSESNLVLKEYLDNPTNQGENFVHYMIGYNYNRLKEFEESCLHLKEAEKLGYKYEILDAMLEDCK